ncbi:MAG TPA: type II toxin-antitoxin system VapC family toxin [Pyrinomonadaceae bacterium]|nr:type II toxin-antitoxin system VapC family toxin [Pyrinomonadaceae bacterium]
MPFVIDASVAMKWYLAEIYQTEAILVLDSDEILFAPDLLLSEVGNIIWKKVRLKELSNKEGLALITSFSRVSERVQIIPSSSLLEPAFEIATAYDRTVYDAMYMSLAVAHSCRLLTADRRLFNSLVQTRLAGNLRWIGDVSL